MKRIPKTPVEFDYDLWTTEDGKCMVRVKITGEVTEVDREVMKILRAEEKMLRRSYGSDGASEDEDGEEKTSDAVLSLDAMPEDDVKTAAWLADSYDLAKEVTMQLMVKTFYAGLTEKQRGVFEHCMIAGESLSSYAREIGVDYTTVQETRNALRKKIKKFFSGTP